MPSTQEIVKQLTEAYEDNGQWQLVGGGDRPATHSGGIRSYIYGISSIRDRADGRFIPFYQTEQDLARVRVAVRNLATYTSVAVGALQALQVYTMGGDWEYEIAPRSGLAPPTGLVEAMQTVLDEDLERNAWVGGLDNEVHDRSREDGESMIAIYGQPDGTVDLRRLEPEHLVAPRNKAALERWLGTDLRSNWDFGVHTVYDERMNRIDHTKHIGYHLIYDETGKDYDYLPAWPQTTLGDSDGKCMHHLRLNVTRGAKRGISDFWPILVDIEREDKLSENLSVGAAVQAAIAYIEQKAPGTTREQASGDLTDAIDQFSRAVAQNSSQQRQRRKLNAGSVLTTSHQYHAGPMGQLRSPIFIQVDQALLRRIGRRWLMPEYMISGDASNGNFASTLVAESPFVKAREADQRSYAAEYKAIFWKALKIAYDMGRFEQYVSRWLDIVASTELLVKPQMVATRDKDALITELSSLYDRKLIDANEFRSESGRDPKPELEGQTGSGQAQPSEAPAQPSGPGAGSMTGDSTRQAVIQSAMESVETKSEALAILESL